MRERLIELLENAKQQNINLLNFESKLIADYLLKNGVVVLPPTNVVYCIYYAKGVGTIAAANVECLQVCELRNLTDYGYYLTREEAEAALERRQTK